MTDRQAIERWENEGGGALAVVVDSNNASNHVTWQHRSRKMFPRSMHIHDADRIDHGPDGRADRLAQLSDEYV